MKKLKLTVGLAAASLALAACSQTPTPAQSETTPAPTPVESTQSDSPQSEAEGASPAPSASPAEGESSTTPIQGDRWVNEVVPVEPDYDRAAGSNLLIHDVRVGEHPGFYRVVFEFVGDGTPGWHGSWSDTVPVEQGRGEPLSVTGSTFLDLAFTGVQMPMDDADYEVYYQGPDTLSVGPIEIDVDGTFEGQLHVGLGLDQQRQLQIATLSNPTRVVLDIKN